MLQFFGVNRCINPSIYIGCWSCTNYGAARAAPAVRLSPPMDILQERVTVATLKNITNLGKVAEEVEQLHCVSKTTILF